MNLYIHYMDESTGTPSLEEKKALPNGSNKDGHNSCTSKLLRQVEIQFLSV